MQTKGSKFIKFQEIKLQEHVRRFTLNFERYTILFSNILERPSSRRSYSKIFNNLL